MRPPSNAWNVSCLQIVVQIALTVTADSLTEMSYFLLTSGKNTCEELWMSAEHLVKYRYIDVIGNNMEQLIT